MKLSKSFLFQIHQEPKALMKSGNDAWCISGESAVFGGIDASAIQLV